jgi:hypothetical protein
MGILKCLYVVVVEVVVVVVIVRKDWLLAIQ